jgi:hypothetical protein
MAFSFEKLVVYQKAIDFADAICSVTEQFPRGYGFLVHQLNRAALSIAANIAEGNGRFTKPDRRNFFGGQTLRSGLTQLLVDARSGTSIISSQPGHPSTGITDDLHRQPGT